MNRFVWTLGLVVASVWGGSSGWLWAGDGCERCGDHPCRKVCRLICEKKTITVPCFKSRCEWVCQSGPCCRGCRHDEPACPTCNADGDGCPCCTGCGKRFVYDETIPGCPKIYGRKVLLLREEKKTVTVYRWVVEDLCEGCEVKAADLPIPPSVRLPQPPAGEAVVVMPSSFRKGRDGKPRRQRRRLSDAGQDSQPREDGHIPAHTLRYRAPRPKASP